MLIQLLVVLRRSGDPWSPQGSAILKMSRQLDCHCSWRSLAGYKSIVLKRENWNGEGNSPTGGRLTFWLRSKVTPAFGKPASFSSTAVWEWWAEKREKVFLWCFYALHGNRIGGTSRNNASFQIMMDPGSCLQNPAASRLHFVLLENWPQVFKGSSSVCYFKHFNTDVTSLQTCEPEAWEDSLKLTMSSLQQCTFLA